MGENRRVTVAMSGGVDSSVAALLAKESGREVRGVYMRTWHNDDAIAPIGKCPWRVDSEDARRVADQIGINFEIVNMIDFYKQWVVRPLIDGYRSGITPNPDILCNQFVKFGALADIAKANGSMALATGHYCKKRKNIDGTFDLVEPEDKNKDQTYFLAYLNQDQIKLAEFPIADLTKGKVRALAERVGLTTAHKKDSQGICFLGKVKVQDFLAHYIEKNPGNIINSEGKIVGRHEGLHNFTIGQRHGLNIPSNSDYNFYVVVGKDRERNELKVAFESEKILYHHRFKIYNLNYTNRTFPEHCDLLCRPRYRDPYQEIYFEKTALNEAIIEFKKSQRALSSGQVVAFYKEGVLLGGGIYA
ncbi:MAG: tRNA 2-thiouridine(34) synthase MnmA [Puniceicoccales bacterium]|jgi:tRNA-specific 2-thiouridylase|nr:tRNA 2-thiouridine(34) synthase MnmA [Puniceicoccales bacterium]